jgi:hypothetical protein
MGCGDTRATCTPWLGGRTMLSNMAFLSKRSPTSRRGRVLTPRPAKGHIMGPVHPAYNPYFQLIFLVETVFSLTTNQPIVFFSRLISTAERCSPQASTPLSEWMKSSSESIILGVSFHR